VNWPSGTPRTRVIATVDKRGWSFADALQIVPGGVVDIEVAPLDSAIPFELVTVNARKLRRSFPRPVEAAPGLVGCGISSFSVNWPSVIVVAGWATAVPRDSCDGPLRPVVYQSQNGGLTWSMIGLPLLG